MKPELEEKLFHDFPLLYDKSAELRHSCMGFGFECGDGWYQLIRDLSEKLYPLVQSYKLEEDDDGWPQASQVKEKYGSLRFYMTFATREMDTIIEEYEDLSTRTCEICGKPGSIDYDKSWLNSTCEQHRHK